MKLVFAVVCVSLALQVSANENEKAQGVAERADAYGQLLFHRVTPENYLDVKINPGIGRTREFLTVLPGALYRGGGTGGKVPLGEASLKALCEAGFSTAVYAYTENWRSINPIHCTNARTGQPNTLTYIAGAGPSAAFKPVFLRKVREVIENPSLGPVFVHCWNGLHASGELAAIALRQFCGWSGTNASNYWLRHARGFPLISRINSYSPVSSLAVSEQVQSVLCQQSR